MGTEAVKPAERLPGVGRIHEAMAAVMAEVGGVGKTRKNDQQGYKYRGIADITLACQLIMARHGVTLIPHEVKTDSFDEFKTAKGAVMFKVRQTITWRFYHSDGSFVPCETTGEGMDSGDKATNKAMTAAQKYALTQAFSIPEEDPDDSEKESHEVTGRNERTPKAEPKPEPPKPDGPYITDEQVQEVFAAAKRAGLKSTAELAPVLEKACGARKAAHVPASKLSSVLDTLLAQEKVPA